MLETFLGHTTLVMNEEGHNNKSHYYHSVEAL